MNHLSESHKWNDIIAGKNNSVANFGPLSLNYDHEHLSYD